MYMLMCGPVELVLAMMMMMMMMMMMIGCVDGEGVRGHKTGV